MKFITDIKIHIHDLSDTEFMSFKANLISYFNSPTLSLDEYASNLLKQLMCRKIDLLRNLRLAKIIEELTKENILNSKIFDEYLSMSSFNSNSNN